MKLPPIFLLLSSLVVLRAADTDKDGLENGVETNTGVFVSPGNTGTDPANPDSNGNGVRDGLENNVLAQTDLDTYGCNFLFFQAFQAGSYTEIDDLEIKDTTSQVVVFSDSFGIDSGWWTFRHLPATQPPTVILNSALGRVQGGTLKLECIGFGSNGDGGYNSNTGALLNVRLPKNFEITYRVRRNQWAGHTQAILVPAANYFLNQTSFDRYSLQCWWGGTNVFASRFINSSGLPSDFFVSSQTLTESIWSTVKISKKDAAVQITVDGTILGGTNLEEFNYSAVGINPAPVPPAIVAKLPDLSEPKAGTVLTLDATSTGNPPPSYQWSKDGILIPASLGGKLSSLSLQADATSEGVWKCVVSNSAGIDFTQTKVVLFEDDDGDGLSNYSETNISKTDPQLSDTDGDGLADGFEIKTSGSDPLKKDSDGDGFLDGFEYYSGYSPVDGASKPAATLEIAPAVELKVLTQLGKTYRVQSSTDLKTWVDTETTIEGTGNLVRGVFKPASGQTTFWRVVER